MILRRKVSSVEIEREKESIKSENTSSILFKLCTTENNCFMDRICGKL